MFGRRPRLNVARMFGGTIMRMGSLARSQGKLVASLVAAASTLMLPAATFGQARVASYQSDGSIGNQGARQALYHAPSDGGMNAPASRYVDADGNPMVVPAGYGAQCGQSCECYGNGYGCNGCGGGGCGYGNCGPGCQGGYPGCCPMGAGGTDPPV